MKFTTRKLTIMALFIAISIVLVYLIHFPIFPAANVLEYDPADIPILVGGFAFGPVAGIILTIIASGIQALTVSAQGGLYGFVAHVLATSSLVIVASIIYRVKHTRAGAIKGLVSGTLAMTVIMFIANFTITPVFYGAAAAKFLAPFIVPFNLIKAGSNSIITFFVYKAISKYIVHGEQFDSKKKAADKI